MDTEKLFLTFVLQKPEYLFHFYKMVLKWMLKVNAEKCLAAINIV